MFFLLTLPFRIVFGLLFGFLFLFFSLLLIPFLLLRVVFKALVFLVALPFVLLMIGGGLLLAFLAILCVMLIPLMPIAFVAFCIWAIARAASRPSLSPQP